MYAATNGHDEIVNTLLSYDAAVDVSDEEGLTALMWAAFLGRNSVVVYLT